MKYTYKNVENSKVRIEITLTEKEWKAAQEKAYQKTKGRYNVQGFRKGHVPMNMLIKLYGEGVFFEEAINIALPEYYYQVLDKEPTIEAIDRPEVDIGKVTPSKLVLIATVPVKPEVKIGQYKGIKVEKVEYNVSDEDLENEVKKLLERNSREVEVTDRPAGSGDITVIDYSGSVDGVKFDGGTAQNQTLVLGSGAFIPGFEEQVVGMNIGEEKDITVKFPDDYHAENLKGKEAVFTVKLHEIKIKELPELNDEFIKDATGEESVEAYKASTMAKLKEANDKKAETETENKLLDAICATAEVEIPEVLVERQIDALVQDMEYRMMYSGLRLEDYLKYVGKTMEEYRQGFKEQATKQVKSQLVIDKIIRNENIAATEEEINSQLEKMASDAGKTLAEYKEKLDDRQKDYVENNVIIEKLFKFLKENNEIA